MSLIKDSSKVLSGITIQRALSLLMVPVIARLFAPKDYGIFQIGLSVCALLSMVGSLALESSIPVSSSRRQAALRTLGASGLGLLNGILFCLILYISQPLLIRVFSKEIVDAIVLMSPVFIPLQIASVSLRNFVGYLGKFGFFAVSDTLSVVANFIVLISSYLLFWKDYHSLIIAGIATLVTQIAIFLYAIRDSQTSPGLLKTKELITELWRVRNFAKFYLPANSVNTASTQLPMTLLGLVFPANVVGLFAMAQRVIDIPAMLTGRALGQVFYPKAAKEYTKSRELTRITWETFTYSCKLALFPVFFIAASSGFLLPILFGVKWSGIAPYVILLLPMVIIRAVETPIGIGFIFSILNQQHKIFIGNLLLSIFRILPLISALQFASSPYVAVFCYSMGSAVGYGSLLAWIFASVSISIRQAFYAWSKYSLMAFLSILPIFLSILKSELHWVIGYLVISVAIFGLIVWFKFLNEEQRSSIKCQVLSKVKF